MTQPIDHCRISFETWVNDKCDNLIQDGEGARVHVLRERWELQYILYQTAYANGMRHVVDIYQPIIDSIIKFKEEHL